MDQPKKKRDPKDSTMSLGDHLEELRARLILAMIGLALGVVVSFTFGTHIITFIEQPYIAAMRERLDDEPQNTAEPNAIKLVEILFDNLTSEMQADPNALTIDPNEAAFLRRVALATIQQYRQMSAPTDSKSLRSLPHYARLQTLAPSEAFAAYMKVSFIAGLILTCPWVFYQLWMFVAAGLYVPFSSSLFVVGALFFLFVVAPISLRFFLIFADLMDVASNWTLQKYISFVTVLMLVFGLAFQTPIAIFILNRTGLVPLKALTQARKYVFLVMFVIAAVVTPPDVISQILLGLPLYALYELGILLAYLSEKKHAAKQEKTPSS